MTVLKAVTDLKAKNALKAMTVLKAVTDLNAMTALKSMTVLNAVRSEGHCYVCGEDFNPVLLAMTVC